MSYQQDIDSYDDVLRFGKYRGRTMSEVLSEDPDYLNWLADEEIVDFSEEMLEELEDITRRLSL